jgi:hypothetical protein
VEDTATGRNRLPANPDTAYSDAILNRAGLCAFGRVGTRFN